MSERWGESREGAAPIQAVLFDLFDTLIYVDRFVRPYLELCRAAGCVERRRSSLTTGAPSLAAFCEFLGVSPPEGREKLQGDLDRIIESAQLFEDSIPVLEELKARGIKTALVSNLSAPYKKCFFSLGLEKHFDVVVFSCDVGCAKPDPAIYSKALELLELEAAQCLMVGDSLKSDVEGPQACGVRGVLLDRDAKLDRGGARRDSHHSAGSSGETVSSLRGVLELV